MDIGGYHYLVDRANNDVQSSPKIVVSRAARSIHSFVQQPATDAQ